MMMTLEVVRFAECLAKDIVYQYGTNCEQDKIRAFVDSSFTHDLNFKAVDLAGIYEYVSRLVQEAHVEVNIKPIEFYSKELV